MFAKFKGALINAVGNMDGPGFPSGLLPSMSGDHNPMRRSASAEGIHTSSHHIPTQDFGAPLKHRYTRPGFLQLNTDDEIQVTADHSIRPIIVPRDISKVPWNSGYAECINAGKSLRNEDQASIYRGVLRTVVTQDVIGAKVADMMPLMPSHPRQVPVNGRNLTIADAIKIPGVVGSVQNGIVDSDPLIPVNNTHSTLPSSVSLPELNGRTESKSSPVMNGCSDPNQKETSQDIRHPLSSESTTGKPTEKVPNSSESLKILNAADLLSPTELLPINQLVNSPSIDTLNSFVTSSPKKSTSGGVVEESLPWTYFGMFDGHAGSGVAVAASQTLHRIIQDKLQNISDLLVAFGLQKTEVSSSHAMNGDNSHDENIKRIEESLELMDGFDSTLLNRSKTTTDGNLIINHDQHLPKTNVVLLFRPPPEKIVTVDNLIIGALESAFWDMDHLIASDKRLYKMPGGCTAIVSLFILGKLYVANAGDSRCIMYKNSKINPMSFDHTPESERQRVKYLGLMRPELLGSDFTHLEFIRRPVRKDLGKKLLYRDAYMSGWSYKTVTMDDLKFPLVYGEGKRSRVLATIGVTRGFGDHELKAQCSQVDIKPFLTPQPEVRVYDLESDGSLTDSDVIIMGTDGLWDVTSNEKAVQVVQSALDHFPESDGQRFKYRYISAAQDLVMTSRGKQKDQKSKNWRTAENKTATIDDISVFVIPLKPYREEYKKWKEARSLVRSIPGGMTSNDTE